MRKILSLILAWFRQPPEPPAPLSKGEISALLYGPLP
jgi:hypothetical protein